MNNADRIAEAVLDDLLPLANGFSDKGYLRFVVGEAVKRELHYIGLEQALAELAELRPGHDNALERLGNGETNDYRLVGNSCWVEVAEQFVVYIRDADGNVAVDIFQNGREMEPSLAGIWATRSDLLGDEEE